MGMGRYVGVGWVCVREGGYVGEWVGMWGSG